MKHGIYQIRNLLTGKRYIGSAAGKGFSNRWRLHLKRLDKMQHHSPKLQAAWNKYGVDAFVFEVLLYCDPQDCLIYEQVALDCFKPEYNICTVAGSPLGVKRSDSTRQKISRNHARMDGCHNPMYGKIHSEESSRKMSAARCGEKNHRAKLSIRDVRTIKRALRLGIQQKKISARFGVNTQTISKINVGRLWSNVK